MTVERYNTPNHDRWNRRTDDSPRSGPPLLLSREATGDDTAVELRSTPDRTLLTTELPDRSLDDVRVTVGGASIRIRAEPSETSPPSGGLDRTITLSERVCGADVAVAYYDPVLTVVVSR